MSMSWNTTRAAHQMLSTIIMWGVEKSQTQFKDTNVNNQIDCINLQIRGKVLEN